MSGRVPGRAGTIVPETHDLKGKHYPVVALRRLDLQAPRVRHHGR
jgi:hypothetical protein